MLLLFTLGCGTDAPPAVRSTPEAPSKRVEAPAPKPASKTIRPCKLLDAETVSEVLGPPVSDVRVQKGDGTDGIAVCSFVYEGGSTIIEVLDRPSSTVRLLLKRGAVAEPDLGVVAAYRESANTLTWAVSDDTVLQLRVDGGRPGFRVPRDRLRRLADAATSRLP